MDKSVVSVSAAPVQVVDRLFDVIELLAKAPKGLSIHEISEMTGLHSSTVHRLLTCLTNRSYARKDPYTSNYCLTLRFLEIGSRLSSSFDIVSLSIDSLNVLSTDIGEVVHLVQRDGIYVTYLHKIEPSTMLVRMDSRVGGCNYLYCTGVGKAILAYLPENEVRDIWASSNVHAITDNTITDIDKLLEELKEVRKNGYAIDNEENELGVYCIACPVFNYEGVPIAAVSISAPVSRVDSSYQERAIEKLKETTTNINEQLGYRPVGE